MNMVRLNITIPEELARQLDELIGPRRKSQFITETLNERIKKIRRKELEEILEEGYKAREKESISIAREFEPADLDGWDEY